MKDVVRFCSRCDANTPHEQFAVDLMGDRESLGPRAFFGFMTAGVSELIRDKRIRCLRCGCGRKA